MLEKCPTFPAVWDSQNPPGIGTSWSPRRKPAILGGMGPYEVLRHWRFVDVTQDGKPVLELDVDPSMGAPDLIYVPDEASWGRVWPDFVQQRDLILAAVKATLRPPDYEYREYEVTPEQLEARRRLASRKPHT